MVVRLSPDCKGAPARAPRIPGLPPGKVLVVSLRAAHWGNLRPLALRQLSDKRLMNTSPQLLNE